MNPPTIKAGDVVVVNFPGVVETKRRPAVVVSSDIYHATRPDVIIGLITSQAVATTPTDYLLQDWAAAGLRRPSVFRAFLVTQPRISIVARIGQLSATDWQAVKVCVDRALA